MSHAEAHQALTEILVDFRLGIVDIDDVMDAVYDYAAAS